MVDINSIFEETENQKRQATMLLNISEQIDPDSATTLTGMKQADKLGMTYPMYRSMDNRDLHPVYNTNTFSLEKSVMDFVNRGGYNAAVVKDELPEVNNFAKTVKHPIVAEWEGLEIDKLFKKFGSDSEALDKAGEELGIKNAAQKAYVRENYRVMKHIAAINLMSQYFADRHWQNWTDEELTEGLTNLQNALGVDLQGIDPKLLRRKELKDVSFWKSISEGSLFVDIVKFRLKSMEGVTPDMLTSIDDTWRADWQLRKLDTLNELLDNSRNSTWGYDVASGVLALPAFILEMAATGGTATVGEVATKTTVKASTKVMAKSIMRDLTKKFTLKNLGKVAVGEAKRTAFMFPGLMAKTGNGMVVDSPYVYQNSDGTWELGMDDKQVDDFMVALTQNTLSRYGETVTESLGGLMPDVPITKVLGKVAPQAKNRSMAFVLHYINKDPVKAKAFAEIIKNNLPFEGFVAEFGEEIVNHLYQYAVTKAGDLTGYEGFDLGADSPIMSWDEASKTAAILAFWSGIPGAGRIGRGSYQAHKVNRWVDQHRQLVENMQNMQMTTINSNKTKEFVDFVHKDNTVIVDAGILNTLYQSSPEFVEAIGVTPEVINKATELGQGVAVSENSLLIAQAQSPEFNTAGEQVLANSKPFGTLSVSKAKADFSEENQQRFKVMEEYKAVIKLKQEELKALGRSRAEIRRTMALLQRFAMTVERLTPEKAVDFIDRLKFVKPEAFEEARKKLAADLIRENSAKLGDIMRTEVLDLESQFSKVKEDAVRDVESLKVGDQAQFKDGNGDFEGIVEKITPKTLIIKNSDGKSVRVMKKSYTQHYTADAYKNLKALKEQLEAKKNQRKSVMNESEVIKLALNMAQLVAKKKSLENFSSEQLTEVHNILSDIVEHGEEYLLPDNFDIELLQNEITKELERRGVLGSENVKHQSDKNGEKYRGGYLAPTKVDDFLSGDHLITVFEKADASTVIHEVSHYVFKCIEYFVNAGLAEKTLVEDFESLKAWAMGQKGVVEDGVINQNEFHERLAEAFETYLLEGREPVSGLASIFATMARMLRQIYGEVKSVGAPINDGVRRVFDNLLASAEEVEADSSLLQVARQMSTALLDVTKKEAEGFMKLIAKAKEQSITELLKQKDKQLKENEKIWRKEAEEIVATDQTLSTFNSIKKGGGLTLSEARLFGLSDKEISELRKKGLIASKNSTGVFPADAAATGGFPTVEEMLDALMKSESPDEFIDSYIDANTQRFNEEFEISGEAISTDLNLQAWDNLMDLLDKSKGKVGRVTRLVELKRRAYDEIKDTTVRDILSDRTELTAIKGLTSELIKAYNKGDYENALKNALKIRTNIQILSLKKGARKFVETSQKRLKKGRTAKKGTIWGHAKEALQELSERFGFSGESKLLKRTDVTAFFNAVNGERESTEKEAVEVADFILNGEGSYLDFTYEQLKDFYNTVEFIYGYGKDVVSEGKEMETKEIKAWREGLIEDMKDMPAKYTQDKTSAWGYIKFATRTLIASGARLKRLMYKIGKYDENSTAVKLFGEMSFAASRQTSLMAEPLREVKDRIEALGTTFNDFDFSVLPELPDDVVASGGKWNKGALISVLLNMGTEKNRQALRDGFYWSDKEISSIADMLNYDQWQLIQEIWDVVGNGSLTHEWINAYRKEYFADPIIEEASPLNVTNSEVTFEIRGGYYPLRYQFLRNIGAQNKMEAKKKLLEVNRTASFNHKRTEQGAGSPISLNPIEIFHHIYDVSHYVAYNELMHKVQRVINNYEVAERIKRTHGFEYYKAMKTIIDHITAPSELMHDDLQAFFQKTKSFLVSQSLWFNPQSIARQWGSWSVGVSDVRDYYPTAILDCTTNPEEMLEIAFAKSGFMRDRHNLKDYDLQEAFTTLDKNGVQKALYNLQQSGFAPMRWADMKVALPLWHAMYRKSLDKGMDDVEAVAKADEFVASTQGGNRSIDKVQVQLSSLKFFAVFMSAANAYHNKNMETIDKMKFGKISTAEGVFTLAIEGLLPMFNSAMVSWVFAGGLNDDDDDDDKATKAFWRTFLTEPVSGMPIIRDVVDFGVGRAFGNRGGQKVALEHSYLRGVNTIINRVFNPVKGPSDNDVYNFVYSTSKVLSELYNVPIIDVYERTMKIARNYGLFDD